MTEVELEAQIDAAYWRRMSAGTAEEQKAAFEEMAELVKQRSPEVIARMERERGLRAS